MKLTNVVCSADLRCLIDLKKLCLRLSNAKYDPSQFSGLVWQHKRIGGNCLVFPIVTEKQKVLGKELFDCVGTPDSCRSLDIL
jgi:TATA-box binding protein (TBP) (component of TFIID and TFIIIB)